MKTTLIIIILVCLGCLSFAMVVQDYAEYKRASEHRIEAVEAEVRALRTEWIGYKAVIWERTEPFTDILPVAGGFIGIREEGGK